MIASRRLAAGLCLFTALAVSACGSSNSTTTDSTTGSASTPTTTPVKTVTQTTSSASTTSASADAATPAAATDPKCTPVDLGIHFAEAEGAAAMEISTFQFINVSSHECHLIGYPGVAVYGRSGRQLRVKVLRESFTGHAPRKVRLAPGKRASFKVQTSAFRPSGGHCVTAYHVRFTPPNDSSTLEIKHRLLICGSSLSVGAVTR